MQTHKYSSLGVVALMFMSTLVLSMQAAPDQRLLGAAVNHGTTTVCHDANGANPVTMDVPNQSLNSHINHGDTLGACPVSSSSSSSVDSSSSSSIDTSTSSSSVDQGTTTVCHNADGATPVTMDVPNQSLDVHMNHGDTLGACPVSSSSSSSSVDQGTTTVCHNADGATPVTMDVSNQSLDAHMNHGDTLGACPVSSSSSSSSSVQSSSNPPQPSLPAQAAAQAHDHPDEGGGYGGNWEEATPILRGHGLGEHAAVLDFVLGTYGLQPWSPYDTGHLQPLAAAKADRSTRIDEAVCSMYRYLQQILTIRPNTSDEYIDWIANRFANATGLDVENVKNALLGRPVPNLDMATLLQTVSSQGCAENAYAYTPDKGAIISRHQDQSHLDEPITAPSELRVEDFSTDNELAFRILKGNENFRDFGNSLTKEMHMIVVRDDLRYFYHVHPDSDETGMWRMPFTPEAGGTYWLYANFSESDGDSYVIRFERVYDGPTGPTGMTVDRSSKRDVDGYHFELKSERSDTGVSLTYHITDDKDQPVHLQNFMGAFGHSVMISTDGSFIHSHPSMRHGEDPTFYLEAPTPGLYRIFVEFQIKNIMHMAVFDWEY